MRLLSCLLTLVLSTSTAFATHYLGGYIRATPIAGQGLAYQITVTMYYNGVTGAAAASAATSLSICFGDKGPLQLANRLSSRPFGSITVDEYSTTYSYAAPGVYAIQVTGMNRTSARNTGDGQQSFSLRTIIQVGGTNQTPVLSIPATGLQVALNQAVKLNLAATDPDRDSLAYSLSYPLTNADPNPCGVALPLRVYQFPNDVRQAGTFRVNAQTGLLSWDVPVEEGQYAVAITVSEWRRGILTSQTQQELVLTVIDRGGPPVTPPAYVPTLQALGTLPEELDRTGLILKVSPNPLTNNVLHVDVATNQAEPIMLQLLDGQGRVHKTLLLTQPSPQQFDMTGQPAGLYFIRAESGGRQVVRKVLKE